MRLKHHTEIKTSPLVLAELAILWVLLSLFFIVPKGASPWIIWPCLVVFYYYFSKMLRTPLTIVEGIPTIIKIETFFLLFYYIIYYLPYQLHVLNISDAAATSFNIRNVYFEYTNISIIASTIGLISFMLGHRKKLPQTTSISAPDKATKKIYSVFPIVIFFLLVFVLLLFIRNGWLFMIQGRYRGSHFETSTAGAIYFLVIHFSMIAIATIVYYSSNHKKLPVSLKYTTALVIMWGLFLLLHGDRNSFFLLLVVGFAGISSFKKKINLLTLILAIVLAFFIYKVIEISRKYDEKSITSFVSSSSQVKFNDSISEGSLGISTITSRVAFHLVPEQYGYFGGKFQLIGFAGIIPYSRKLIVTPGDPFTTSSKVLTRGLLTTRASWGLGTNIISDLYLDFGIWGVISGMYLLGIFASIAQFKICENDSSLKWTVIYLLALGLFAELPRYSMAFPVRNIIWTFCLFWILDKIIHTKFERLHIR